MECANHLKVRVRCNTPHGVQYARAVPAATSPATAPRVAVAVAPLLLPVAAPMAPDGRPAPRVAPGLGLSLSGLLSGLSARSRTSGAALAAGPEATTVRNAYLAWTLLSAQGQVIRSGTQLVPVYGDGQWRALDLVLDVDLSGEDTRTGTLRVREVNEGSNAVYFDSLTITRPQDRALVSQENHYYPFGMALSGVAVNTTAQAQESKDQFNGGSELQDALLGSEQGIYSTFYRNYDPATGRFQGVDPLADKYASDSPYSFGFNDPVNFNDPNGDDPIMVNGRLVNQRDVVTGAETWTGSALEYQTFLAGGPGVTYGGQEVINRDGVTGYYSFSSSSTTSNDPGSVTKTNNIGNISIAAHFTTIALKVTGERGVFGSALDFSEKQYGFASDMFGGSEGALTLNKGRNLDKLSYNLTKAKSMINPLTGAILKTGELNRFIKSSTKFLSKTGAKLGPMGNLLAGGKILYDATHNTWDVSTFIDAGLLVGGVLLASNPVGLSAIAAYGIADYAFGINDAIDANFGRNSAFYQDLTR